MKINLNCPINTLGYGYASWNILKQLTKNGHEISLFPIGQSDTNVLNSQDELNLLQKTINNASLCDYDSPSLKIWHQNQLANTIGRGKRIAWPFFELNKFDDIELHHLNNQDLLIVSSAWAKKVIEENGIKTKTIVVPLGVDRDIFNNTNNKGNQSPNYRFIHCGKFEIRKGIDFIYEVFNKAFELIDNVELHICSENPFLSKEQNNEWVNLFKGGKLGDKVYFHNRLPKQTQLAELMNQCDCGLFPARAEGWNMELLECMSLGLDIITSNYSAHTEYCNKDNSKLIDIDGLENSYDGIFFWGQGEWAALGEKQEEQCIEYMRKLYKQGRQLNTEGIKTAEKLSWQNTAQLLIEAIQE
jgi:glycosyltransferase involved in cell wall biosynthesis